MLSREIKPNTHSIKARASTEADNPRSFDRSQQNGNKGHPEKTRDARHYSHPTF